MRFKKSYNSNPDCNWIKENLSPYLDRALPEDQVSTIHQHLRYCRFCSAELDGLCKTLAALGDFREEPLPGSIRNFRVPRSLFMDVLPFFEYFREEKREVTFGSLAPYFSATLILIMLATVWMTLDQREFKQRYNQSNYVEVHAKL